MITWSGSVWRIWPSDSLTLILLLSVVFGQNQNLSSPLFCSNSFYSSPVIFSTDFYTVHLHFLSSPILFSPLSHPSFSLAPTWPPSLHCHWPEVIPSLCCWKNRKWRKIVPNNAIISADVHFRTELDKERTRVNGLSVCGFLTRQPSHYGSFNHGTFFLTAIFTIYWCSCWLSCFFGEGSWKWFLFRNAVSCIHLSVCFSRASMRQAATALHLASAKCNLLKPRWEGWGGELNDYNSPGMWAIHPQ